MKGPPLNIKLESEPLEIECNPFNFSSSGTTGKKRRKKKDKEKKVSIQHKIFDDEVHFTLRDKFLSLQSKYRFKNIFYFAATWAAI